MQFSVITISVSAGAHKFEIIQMETINAINDAKKCISSHKKMLLKIAVFRAHTHIHTNAHSLKLVSN